MSLKLGLAGAMLVIFTVNLPFGYWRARTRKFTFQWFLAIHLPVPLAVGIRVLAGIGWRLSTLPLLVGAFAAGQYEWQVASRPRQTILSLKEPPMYLVRDVLHCKPGKVGEMVKRFKRVIPVMERLDLKPFRISTDAGGERFWTVVLEFEVDSISDWVAIEGKIMSDEEMGQIMAGYHDAVIGGRREYFKVEA